MNRRDGSGGRSRWPGVDVADWVDRRFGTRASRREDRLPFDLANHQPAAVSRVSAARKRGVRFMSQMVGGCARLRLFRHDAGIGAVWPSIWNEGGDLRKEGGAGGSELKTPVVINRGMSACTSLERALNGAWRRRRRLRGELTEIPTSLGSHVAGAWWDGFCHS